MGLQKDRTRSSVHGLGTLEVREVEPSEAADFSKAGYLDGDVGTTVEDFREMEELKDETGSLVDVKEKSKMTRLATGLMQTTIDEINLIKGASGKVHAIRYYGQSHESPDRYQYIIADKCRINPSVPLGYKPGKRVLPFNAWALKQAELSYDVPDVYVMEAKGSIAMTSLALWLSPRHGFGVATAKVYDASGFGRHGTLTTDYASNWLAGTTPVYILRFDGTNDALDLGDVLDDDGSADFSIDMWINIPAANGTLQEILTKKSVITDHTAGYAIWRDTSNKINFKLSDGSGSVTITTAASVTQNVMTHIGVTVDRNGNAQLYINGTASGSASSVAAITSGTNALSLYLAREGTSSTPGCGQVDIGDVRIYKTVAAITAHYAAERSYYGV